MKNEDQILQSVREGTLSVDAGLELLLQLRRSAAAPACSERIDPPVSTSEEASSEFTMEVRALCATVLGQSPDKIVLNASFFELGMDSFKILQLFHRVRERYGVEIDPTRLPEFSSVARLAAYLAGAAGKSPARLPAQMSTPPQPGTCSAPSACEMDFGLYFFANYDPSRENDKYRLLIDAVKYADENGFSSVFSPERHFEDFGGLFPNPAVVNAALAMVTRQIQIRAGSVVSPLHDALRIAEDWAVVDNLSDGRAGVAFTYGWQCDDFVLYPDRYLQRHAVMFEQIQTVRRLWRGESIRRVNGLGREVEIRTYPRPIQREIPVWVTCAISRDSFINAGRVGANIVTFLLGQSLADLKEKIESYRAALLESGFDPAKGRVSLMVHTYLGEDLSLVKEQVRKPFLSFIRAQAQLARNLVRSVDPSQDITDQKTVDQLMDIGFERFFGDSGLLGTAESCARAVRRFRDMGVDEVSCLIDFGLDYDAVMAGLRRLNDLKNSFRPSSKPRNIFPDIAAQGSRRTVSLNGAGQEAHAKKNGAHPEQTTSNGNGHANGAGPLCDQLEAFRSYLPGGSRVPGASGASLEKANGAAALPPGSSAGPQYPQVTHHAAALHEPFPLTAVQKAYWMGRNPRFELGSTSTHGYVELKVSLDLRRFEAALQQVIDRHPMLRAVVLSGREQRILPGRLEYRIPIIDLSDRSPEEQEKQLLAARDEQSHRIFDPTRWPLFDFRAFILARGRQYLLFGFDSLIADAASLTLVFREIMEFYQNPEKQLPQPAIAFPDYMRGYEEFQRSATYTKDREYWLGRIDELPPAPAIPLRKSPADVQQSRFLRKSAVIPTALWQRIKAKAQAELVTPTAFLFTAFAEVLARASRQQRFTLNLTVFNRFPFHPDVNQIVGDFTSLMLVDVNYRQEKTLWENSALVQGTILQSLMHRHFDGVEVIKELARRRDLLGRAVIPIVFTSNLLNTEEGRDGLSEIGEIAYMITQTTQAYLDNQVAENRDGLYIAWDYVAELFEPSVIDQLFRDYVHLIERAVQVTEMATASDLEIFVARYNQTADPSIRPATLPALFREQARKTPDAPAIRFGGQAVTYRELDERSNQVAHFLKAQGVGRGSRVAVLTPRSIQSIVEVLGVVKSGAAYVPIDSEYPEQRQRYIREKSGSRLLLDASAGERIRRDFPVGEFEPALHPEDLAYVIFTSGSTGQPKGVMITHGVASNTIVDLNRRFSVGAGDRILGISSMCFDLSVYDVFGAFASGACLVLIDDIRNPRNLVQSVCAEKITIWNSVPTLFRMFVEALAPSDDASSLRLAMMSGDWIPINVPPLAQKKLPGAKLISLGGATEASIWSIWYPIERIEPAWKSIPYGYPLANQSFYVLDEKLEFCAIDTPGELFIGGAGLSSGYYDEPEKTDRAFITHSRLGRLYRTGDWGVWRRAGFIEFLGRRDHQVKIRGFRVELGEIENRLVQHPAVKQAVVIDKSDAHGNRSLAAFIVPK